MEGLFCATHFRICLSRFGRNKGDWKKLPGDIFFRGDQRKGSSFVFPQKRKWSTKTKMKSSSPFPLSWLRDRIRSQDLRIRYRLGFSSVVNIRIMVARYADSAGSESIGWEDLSYILIGKYLVVTSLDRFLTWFWCSPHVNSNNSLVPEM